MSDCLASSGSEIRFAINLSKALKGKGFPFSFRLVICTFPSTTAMSADSIPAAAKSLDNCSSCLNNSTTLEFLGKRRLAKTSFGFLEDCPKDELLGFVIPFTLKVTTFPPKPISTELGDLAASLFTDL